MIGFFAATGLLVPLVFHGAVYALTPISSLETLTSLGTAPFLRDFQHETSSLEVSISDDANETILVQFAELPINHFGECSETYQNRYWAQDKWYKPGGPVIVLDAGEQTGTAHLVDLKKGYFAELLQELGAMGIVWEHRFYGQSSPVPWQDHIQYLTFEQGLADLPAMAANFSHPNWPGIDLSSASTPWVMTGCSYAGARSATTRQAYPDSIFAAIAGGAVVQWEAPGWRYYQPIMRGMKAHGEGGCVRDVQAANTRLQELLDDPATRSATKHRFFRDYPQFWNISNAAMQVFLSSTFQQWQYSKNKVVGKFCDKLEFDPDTNTTAPPEGWAPTRDIDWLVHHMAETYGWTGSSQKAPLDSRSSMVERGNGLSDLSAWGYQTCTQLDITILSNPKLHHFTLDYATRKNTLRPCMKHWPNVTTYVSPATGRKLDKKFGGWNMRPSNVLWTTGEFDPWQNKQPLSLLGNAPPVEVLSKPPRCNAQLPQSQIFGHIVTGESHCGDMWWRTTNKAVQKTRKLYAESLRAWLPCFEKKSKARVTPKIPPKCTYTS